MRVLVHFRFLPEVFIFGSSLEGKAYRAQSQAQPVVHRHIECFLTRLNSRGEVFPFLSHSRKVCSSPGAIIHYGCCYHLNLAPVLFFFVSFFHDYIFELNAKDSKTPRKRNKRKGHTFKKSKDKRPPGFTFEIWSCILKQKFY